jgi:hypothetical protein
LTKESGSGFVWCQVGVEGKGVAKDSSKHTYMAMFEEEGKLHSNHIKALIFQLMMMLYLYIKIFKDIPADE